jgi:ABC-type dipeptide/oligopeptide/nickel transport system permease component
MVTATLVILSNLLADLVCAALDPRIRLGARATP